MDGLKFVALDQDDLAVVSTHLQDAVVKVADIVWLPKDKRLVVGLNRFDWEVTLDPDPQYRRRRSALRFDRVLACKCRHVTSADKEAVLNLLAIEFDQQAPPAGVVTLTFSGGAALRLEVECLEAELADLGAVWTTTACPGHAIDDQPIVETEVRRG
ncbi:MAG: DUF2948 family protein [Rhizobiales bacterium]|nr:DUF2948 family protein [Hyphomicrobiales bacterium]